MILHDEEGFTLIEILTSLFILGILFSFTIPIFLQIKEDELKKGLHLEASSFLQAELEQRKVMPSIASSGRKQKKSKIVRSLVYELNWKVQQTRHHFYKYVVEIRWKRCKQEECFTLCTYRYVSY
jgi:prepilin-type N-terminal cleavage/methylation domain-containing protein